MDRRMDGQKEGRMDGRTDGWMDDIYFILSSETNAYLKQKNALVIDISLLFY